MLEIKFRAWDKTKKRMFFNVQNAYDTLEAHYPEEMENASDEEKDKFTIYESSFGSVLKHQDWVVMQFTGLRDSKGKEIYEGDFVTFGNWKPGDWKIGWNEDCARFDLFWTGGGEEGTMNLCDEDYEVMLRLTVVGNIYETSFAVGVGRD